ncbi:MAG: pyruvate, phosphate dikinase, partial [Lentisphaeria bacterium]|nr:pyruvate, phosphate dikinase [Lentisphaeria bacterium]
MAKWAMRLSTGMPKLDRVFRGLMPGDNLVWQVDAIEDYVEFVRPYADYARENRQRLIYFRFADHPPLLPPEAGAVLCTIDPGAGFEPFIAEIHRVISEEGRASLFLFDCLSELAPDWNSDRMLGNFFMLTCPYLYDRAAIAYFAVFRNYHSFHAVRPITNTTQILVDVYRREKRLYIQPVKVQYRHSSTMYMLHVRERDDFVPVTQSSVITETLAGVPWSRSDPANYLLGCWSRTFAEAEAIQHDLDRNVDRSSEAEHYFHRLMRMLISRDEPMLRLAERHFTLKDLLQIRKRMIGTGLIGGKSVGMLLARSILCQADPRWIPLLEKHDSFYVGADVFYTYLVQNGCWWMMQKHKAGHQHEDETETARRRILAGDFPEYIVDQFADMLDYFGQSPIIVRSSSLMEDNFGNAFAGKYESVFCANQGGQHKRLEDFLCAVRTVYASTMSEAALEYRAARGLLGRDEQMGLLIQRVSGATYGSLFFPQAAGVAFSFNPYVWNSRIDPEAGMVRIVFGTGTRAVDRADDDYTRVVALNDPACRPEASFDEVRQYAQRRVDVLDLEGNHLTPTSFQEIVQHCPGIPLRMFTSRDMQAERRLREMHRPVDLSLMEVLTFDQLLYHTSFVQDMKDMLETLRTAYGSDVDVEWTLNFFDGDRYHINVVQCRPLQARGTGSPVDTPQDIPDDRLVVEARGGVVGKSLETKLDWLIYVTPSVYGELPMSDRYQVAHTIGELAHHASLDEQTIMLVGPGRWGTTTPALGVPATFAEIAPVTVLCELVMMRENLIPDASLGTHFFNEMVENDVLYLALFPNRQGNRLNRGFFETDMPNRLLDLLPQARDWAAAIKVICAHDMPRKQDIW